MMRLSPLLLLSGLLVGCATAEGPEPAEPSHTAEYAVDTDPPRDDGRLALRVNEQTVPIVDIVLRQEPDGEQEMLFLAEQATCREVRDPMLVEPVLRYTMEGRATDENQTVPADFPAGTWTYDALGVTGSSPPGSGHVTVTDVPSTGNRTLTNTGSARIEGVAQFVSADGQVELRGPYEAHVCEVHVGTIPG